MKPFSLLLFLSIFFVSGCGQDVLPPSPIQDSPDELARQATTSTPPLPENPTSTRTSPTTQPAPRATAGAALTQAASSRLALTDQAGIESVQTALPGANRTPGPELLGTARAVLTELEIEITSSYSPGRQWQAKRIMAFPVSDESRKKYRNFYYSFLGVSCVAATCGANVGLEWILVDEWSELDIGYSIPEPLGWSPKENDFYFFDSIIPDGCQPTGGFQGNLRRVDLDTGIVEQIPLTWTGGMAISPGSSHLVFYNREERGGMAGIYDLNRDEVEWREIDLGTEDELWYAGDFTWSPDSQSVVFIIRHGDACFPSGTSLLRIDLGETGVHTLVEMDDRPFTIEAWPEPDLVQLSGEGRQWGLDPETGALVEKERPT